MTVHSLDIQAIARALGGKCTGRFTANVPGPGHRPHDGSLSITIKRGRLCVYSHAGDNWKECRDYVMDRLGIDRSSARPKPVFTVVSPQEEDNEAKKKAKRAIEIWHGSVDPRGTIVEHYLREHRGLRLTADIAGKVIRFHGSLWFDHNMRLPGMICLMRDIKTNDPRAIHRTFLHRETAEKIDRRMLGPAKGTAIKFDPTPTSGVMIGEGVETCLSAREAGLGPAVWALGSSVAIRTFPVIAAIPTLTIIQENDDTSRRDSAVCRDRFLKAGKLVNIVRSRIGNDLNDAWRAGRVG
jgi:hypothetical protein